MIYSFALALHLVWSRMFGLMAEHVPGFQIDGQITKEWSGWFGVVQPDRRVVVDGKLMTHSMADP